MSVAVERERGISPSLGAVITSLVVALLGVADATYLTIEHFRSSTTFACPETGTINCAKVTTSKWSHIGPIPVAILGLAFFVGMAVLCLPPLWRERRLDVLRVVGAVVGVLSALYLVYIELFKVDAICLYCTGVHVLSLILLGAVLWGVSSRPITLT